MAESQKYIQKKIVSGLAISMLARMLAMILRIGAVLLLPLWLTPAEIGYTALILACINLPITFADLGFGTALIKHQNLEERDFHSVFTLNIFTSMLLAFTLLAAAKPLSYVLNAPELLPLIPIAVFAIPLSILSIIPNVKLQRELRFQSLAVRDFLGEITFAASSVTLAALGFGALSVACALVLHRLVRYLVASISVDWKPKLRFSLKSIKKLFNFSALQMLSLIFSQLFYNLDKILISTFLSPTALGYYNLSVQVAVNPISSLVGAARNVFFASFSKIQNQIESCQKLFLQITRYLILIPLALSSLGIPWIAYIPNVYGSQWQAAVPIAQILFASAIVFSLDLIEGIMIAIGGASRRVLSSLTRLCIMIALILSFHQNLSPSLVAISLIIASLIAATINLQFISKRLQIRPSDLLTHSHKLWLLLPLLSISLLFSHYIANQNLIHTLLFTLVCSFTLLITFKNELKALIKALLTKKSKQPST